MFSLYIFGTLSIYLWAMPYMRLQKYFLFQIREFDSESVSRMIEYIYTDELKNPGEFDTKLIEPHVYMRRHTQLNCCIFRPALYNIE